MEWFRTFFSEVMWLQEEVQANNTPIKRNNLTMFLKAVNQNRQLFKEDLLEEN